MNDPAKMDEFLKSAMTSDKPSGLSEQFQDHLQLRLATQRLTSAGHWKLNIYLLLSTLASAAVMWWLAIPWVILLPSIFVPAIFFVIFQRTMWPK
jgi:hypothetical protein